MQDASLEDFNAKINKIIANQISNKKEYNGSLGLQDTNLDDMKEIIEKVDKNKTDVKTKEDAIMDNIEEKLKQLNGDVEQKSNVQSHENDHGDKFKF